tara:strand:- start:64 stop:291 length:228 start_codon:yes stop_codon:yes gene_type:complete
MEQNKIEDIIRRLDRVEEAFARLQHISLYKLKEYFESNDIDETIDILQGFAESIYEEQSGKDYITGEDIDNGSSK